FFQAEDGIRDGHVTGVQTCALPIYVSLGGGLGDLKGRVFRIGHMGDLNEPMLLGALAAVEMSLGLCKVPHRKGGVDAAMAFLARSEERRVGKECSGRGAWWR